MKAARTALQRNVPFAYGTILALTGIAKGMWQGAYAWFLSARLGFTPSEIALVIGAQFILQILLEVPSGAWADRGRTRQVLLGAYIGFVLYCLTYFVAGSRHDPKEGALVFALVAEAFFGIGSALLSGTLDAWIAEKQREAALESRVDFAKRLRRVHSISQLWGAAPSALVGTLAFVMAATGDPELPWLLGAVGYVLAGLIVFVAVSDRQPQPPPQGALRASRLQAIGRQTGRALSFLFEQPGTFKVFLRSSFAFMPFFATQVFWIPFLAQTLFVGHADMIGGESVPVLGGIPLIASIWGAGELARALGGSMFSGKKAGSQHRRVTVLGVMMIVYGLGIGSQLAAVLLDWHEIQLFCLGYLACRAAEGRVRRDVAVVTDESIVSDRATLRSLDSFVKAILGLIYITLVGALMQADPIVAYLFIALTAGFAGAQFLTLRSQARVHDLPTNLEPVAVDRDRPRRIRKSQVATLGFGLLLAVSASAINADSRAVWSFLNEQSPEGAVVNMEQTEARQSDRGTATTTWSMTGGSQTRPVGCRVRIDEPLDLWDNELSEPTRARLREIGGVYYFEFRVPHALSLRTLKVRLSERGPDAITCFRIAPDKDLEFLERRVVPTRVFRFAARPSGTNFVVFELIVGFFVVVMLIGLASYDGRRRLQDALELTPGLVLDQAREVAKISADSIIHPTQGLPTRGFSVFDEFARDLGASCIIIGGFSFVSDEKGKVREFWLHQYGQAFLPEEEESKFIPGWVLAGHPDGEGSDSYSRRLAGKFDGATTASWSTPLRDIAVPSKAREVDEPFAAAGLVSRDRGEQSSTRVRGAGFAIAIYGPDRASRYVAPVERKVLQLLGEIARMQTERARRNVNTHDALHWAKTVLDMIRLPLKGVVRRYGGSLPPAAEVEINGSVSRATLGMERLAHRLGAAHEGEAQEPVSLHQGLAEIANYFTTSWHGTMRVEVVRGDDVPDLSVAPNSWVVLEGALIELVWNAGKHGCDPERRHVAATIRVRRDDRRLRFDVENDRPWSSAKAGTPRGFGLQTTPKRIVEAGGSFVALGGDDQVTRVSFTLPLRFLETR